MILNLSILTQNVNERRKKTYKIFFYLKYVKYICITMQDSKNERLRQDLNLHDYTLETFDIY